MRLLITLSPLQDTPQPISKHHIQSTFYKIFKAIKLNKIHLKEGYKYFCFSNIFPFKKNKEFKKSSKLNILFSSPQKDLIYSLNGYLNSKPIINLGKYKFQIENSKALNNFYNKTNLVLITATPIVITIHKHLFTKFNIKSDREQLLWNNGMPLNAFVEGLNINLIRKYNKYNNTQVDEKINLIKNFKFKNFALVPYQKGKIAASYWEFVPNIKSKLVKQIVNFGLDCGFGEKNSAGFGFMNIIN
ncbi:CRISPR-associated endoribonuclease Cas6 [Candidatus Dojkabacteria bacterium]|nr:CRISPR-associated endoribonuclease Cas6 [Candidatus Dojkabacteria bacterium]